MMMIPTRIHQTGFIKHLCLSNTLSLQGIQPYLSSHDSKLTTFTINRQHGKILVLQIACCRPFIVRRFYQVWDMSLFCDNLDTFREFLLIVAYFVPHLSILAMFST